MVIIILVETSFLSIFEASGNNGELGFLISAIFGIVILVTPSRRPEIKILTPLSLLELSKVPTWWSQNVDFCTFLL